MTEHKAGKMEKPLTAPSLQQGQLLSTQAPQWLAVGGPRAKAGAVSRSQWAGRRAGGGLLASLDKDNTTKPN